MCIQSLQPTLHSHLAMPYTAICLNEHNIFTVTTDRFIGIYLAIHTFIQLIYYAIILVDGEVLMYLFQYIIIIMVCIDMAWIMAELALYARE